MFHAEDSTEDSMVVSWTQDGNGGSPITKYTIEVVNSSDDDMMTFSVDASKMQAEITDLEIG